MKSAYVKNGDTITQVIWDGLAGRYALVRDGVTENIILWDGAPYTPPAGCVIVAEADAPPLAEQNQ